MAAALTQKMKPVQMYAPIKRIDETNREIEVYAFVNEVVDGEGGVRLLRSAMEAATADYMEFANVREMHQPSAVGIVRTLVWDEKGCRQIIRVVDDIAWSKCLAGVYKGVSVGVIPTLARGLDVTACKWAETSLVDRPKDPGSKFICLRADGVDEIDETTIIEVTVVENTSIIQDFASAMALDQLWDKGYEAMDALWCVLYDIAASTVDNKAELIGASIDQFKQFIINHIAGGNLLAAKQRMVIALPAGTTPEQVVGLRRSLMAPASAVPADLSTEQISRIEKIVKDVVNNPELKRGQIDTESMTNIKGALEEVLTRSYGAINPIIEGLPAVIERLELASTAKVAEVQTELEQVNTSLSGVIERIVKVENSPADIIAPIRNTEAFRRMYLGQDRSFAANEVQAGGEPNGKFKTRSEVQAEINRISSPELVRGYSSTQRDAAMATVQELKRLADVLPD